MSLYCYTTVQLSNSHETLLEKYLLLEQQINETRPANVCGIVSELQLCVSKLQPVVDVCCAMLLNSDAPDVTSLLQTNGLYFC